MFIFCFVFCLFVCFFVEGGGYIQSSLALRTPRYYGLPDNKVAAKSPIKTDYRRLNEINSRYYGLSNTRNNDTKSVIRGFWSYLNEYKIALKLTCQRKFAEMSYQIYQQLCRLFLLWNTVNRTQPKLTACNSYHLKFKTL